MKDYRLHTAQALVLSSVVGASTAVRAHDTNTSHPRITEMVVKSLKEQEFAGLRLNNKAAGIVVSRF